MTSPDPASLPLEVLDGVLAVARLPAAAPLPEGLLQGPLASVTRSGEETSLVLTEAAVPRLPPGARVERGFRALKVRGPLEFDQLGVLAALAAPLATAGVSLLALSTFDTDYLLVRQRDLDAAVAALGRAGFPVGTTS